MGAPEEMVERYERRDEDPRFPVRSENWEAVQLFLACATQWRRAGLAGVATGLDYAAVEAVMRLRHMTARAERFEELRILEAAALDEMGKERRRAGPR